MCWNAKYEQHATVFAVHCERARVLGLLVCCRCVSNGSGSRTAAGRERARTMWMAVHHVLAYVLVVDPFNGLVHRCPNCKVAQISRECSVYHVLVVSRAHVRCNVSHLVDMPLGSSVPATHIATKKKKAKKRKTEHDKHHL